MKTTKINKKAGISSYLKRQLNTSMVHLVGSRLRARFAPTVRTVAMYKAYCFHCTYMAKSKDMSPIQYDQILELKVAQFFLQSCPKSRQQFCSGIQTRIIGVEGNFKFANFDFCKCPSMILFKKIKHCLCDQIGRFLKAFSCQFSFKSSPNIWLLLGLL